MAANIPEQKLKYTDYFIIDANGKLGIDTTRDVTKLSDKQIGTMAVEAASNELNRRKDKLKTSNEDYDSKDFTMKDIYPTYSKYKLSLLKSIGDLSNDMGFSYVMRDQLGMVGKLFRPKFTWKDENNKPISEADKLAEIKKTVTPEYFQELMGQYNPQAPEVVNIIQKAAEPEMKMRDLYAEAVANQAKAAQEIPLSQQISQRIAASNQQIAPTDQVGRPVNLLPVMKPAIISQQAPIKPVMNAFNFKQIAPLIQAQAYRKKITQDLQGQPEANRPSWTDYFAKVRR